MLYDDESQEGETDSETNSENSEENAIDININTNPVLISSVIRKNHINKTMYISRLFDFIIYYFKDVFIFFGNSTYNVCKLIFKLSWVYILWIIAHYAASHLYIQMCVPNTFYGFVISPFVAVSPHCQALRWIVYNAGANINNMWITFGVWMQNQIMYISN